MQKSSLKLKYNTKSNMNNDLAKIKAVKIADDDLFYIDKLKNFKTEDESRKEDGELTYKTYKRSSVFMFADEDKTSVLIFDFEKVERTNIELGDVYTKEQFQKIIQLMKKAGHNFVEAIKETSNKKITEVTI
ncbi:MAG: hypothetical protein K9L56_14735 [Clostridiales bacterium]|nr:hypothetical protein [Clostridiales bacterium]